MPSIIEHPSSQTTKIIILGHSGAGKTGQLASLAAAGYNLRILDFDNGVDILKDILTSKDPKWQKNYPPEAAARVVYKTFTDKMKIIGGKAVPITASAFSGALGLLESWKDGDLNLGSIDSWGPQDILVIDTTTGFGRAAFNHVLGMNGKLINQPTGNLWRQAMGQAQSLCEDVFEYLTSSQVKCNVILNAHINYQDEPGSVRSDENEAIPQRGYMTLLGRAMGPKVPRLFNSVLRLKKVAGTIALYTRDFENVDLKTSAPTRVKDRYPIETGLADYFRDVRIELQPQPTPGAPS